MRTIKAQVFYELQENCQDDASYPQVYTDDMHDCFRELCDGEPSPSGRHEISAEKIKRLAETKHGEVKKFLLRAISAA